MNQNVPDVIFMRSDEVRRITGLSKTEMYRQISDGRFPRPLKLGHRTVCWPSDKIKAWQDQKEIDALLEELL